MDPLLDTRTPVYQTLNCCTGCPDASDLGHPSCTAIVAETGCSVVRRLQSNIFLVLAENYTTRIEAAIFPITTHRLQLAWHHLVSGAGSAYDQDTSPEQWAIVSPRCGIMF